jgi:hypothetical protein
MCVVNCHWGLSILFRESNWIHLIAICGEFLVESSEDPLFRCKFTNASMEKITKWFSEGIILYFFVANEQPYHPNSFQILCFGRAWYQQDWHSRIVIKTILYKWCIHHHLLVQTLLSPCCEKDPSSGASFIRTFMLPGIKTLSRHQRQTTL